MPLEQNGAALYFYAYFQESKVGKTGLVVTVDVWRNRVEVVTGGSATEMGDGIYYYQLAGATNNAEGEYIAIFKTATTTVDAQHVPAIWCVDKAGVENLNATVSSRASQTSLDTLDDFVDTEVAAIKAKTDNLPAAPAAVGDIPTAAAIRAEIDSNSTDLNAIIATLTTIQGLVDDLEGRLTALRAGYLDNLSAGAVALQATLTTVAGYLDTEVAAILAAVDTEVAAIKAKTDNLPASPAAVGSAMTLAAGAVDAAAIATGAIDADALAADAGTELGTAVWASATRTLTSGAAPTAADVADAVWDEALSGHLTAGSTGARLNSATDPLGPGALTYTYTLTRSDTAAPIDDASVWVTTDAGGTNVIASGRTNGSGQVAFYLDAGTYYFWRSKSGFDFINPDTEIVA